MAGPADAGHDEGMTETQPQDQAPRTGEAPTDAAPPTSGTRGFFDQIRASGVRRSSDRWVAGVAGGLARRLGVDPLLIRAGLIALLVFGIGFLAYLIAWALLPDENDSIVAERALHDGDGWGIFLIVVIALSVFGVGPLFTNVDGWLSLLMTLALVAGTWWLVTRYRGTGTPAAGPPVDGTTPGATTAMPHSPASQSPMPQSSTPQTRPQPVWAPAGPSHAGYEPPPAAARSQSAPASDAYTRPKAPKAGLAGLLVVLGAALAGYGIGQALGAVGTASADLVAMLGATAAAGLATMVLGLLGRRSALTGLVSIGLAVSLLLTWGVTTAPDGGGNTTWVPSADSPTSTYAWNAGQATLDLRGITERPDTREITASVSFGELVIYVPEGITTTVVSDAWLGGVTVTGDGASSESQSQEGPSMTAEHVFGDGSEADLTVNANVRLGSIRIVSPSDPS